MSQRRSTPAVVFDFDGTIGDTRALILSCFRATYEPMEPPFPGDTEVGVI
ncbi:MAG: HAD hydrolase-like protein [Spirochaetaceae bacterium]